MCTFNSTIKKSVNHRLRHIDTHLAYFVLCRTLVQENIVMLNQFLTKQSKYQNQGLICPLFFNKRKRYVIKMTLHTFGIASNQNYVY